MSTSSEGAKVAALVEMAEAGIPPDIQELLTLGNPLKGVAPGALWRAFARFEREVSTNKDETIAKMEAALEPFVELLENFVGDDEDDFDSYAPHRFDRQKQVTVGMLRRAAAALASTKKEG